MLKTSRRAPFAGRHCVWILQGEETKELSCLCFAASCTYVQIKKNGSLPTFENSDCSCLQGHMFLATIRKTF